MRTRVGVTINGTFREAEVDTRMILADMIRDVFRLTGTHIGCATGNCGACTIILDGVTVKSCSVLAADVDGSTIMTVEGLAPDPGELHPIQEAFVRNQGLQCGFCTPGMLMSTKFLLDANPDPSEEEIRHGIAGNLCRCTGYHFIVTSIQDAAATLRAGASGATEPGSTGGS